MVVRAYFSFLEVVFEAGEFQVFSVAGVLGYSVCLVDPEIDEFVDVCSGLGCLRNVDEDLGFGSASSLSEKLENVPFDDVVSRASAYAVVHLAEAFQAERQPVYFQI